MCGGRRGTAGSSALQAGGRSGATVEADAVARAECGCGGLDRNAGQLWKRHAGGGQCVADALFERNVLRVQAGAELGGAAQIGARGEDAEGAIMVSSP